MLILFSYILPILSILFALAALVVGCVALSFVVGLKNSTHQVVWKEADAKIEDAVDPFETVEDEVLKFEQNPNKRIKKEEPKNDDFVDFDDPSTTSANW